MSAITLRGRVFVHGDIHAVTGLHIGAATAALAIGGADSPVMRDSLTRRPYVPGSSLRGKMRSLSEKNEGLSQSWPIGSNVNIHACRTRDSYVECDLCHIFGVPAQDFASPTRLIVRDVMLGDESARELEEARPDLPYTELKWEAAIDRVTSAATPRNIERVPAGARFSNMEMVFNVYERVDVERFSRVLTAMQLVEDDYLGGAGSRGSGKIKFTNLTISCRANGDYATMIAWQAPGAENEVTIESLQRPEMLEHLREWLGDTMVFE